MNPKEEEEEKKRKENWVRIVPRENLFHLDYDDSLKVLFTRLTNESATFLPRYFSFSTDTKENFQGKKGKRKGEGEGGWKMKMKTQVSRIVISFG